MLNARPIVHALSAEAEAEATVRSISEDYIIEVRSFRKNYIYKALVLHTIRSLFSGIEFRYKSILLLADPLHAPPFIQEIGIASLEIIYSDLPSFDGFTS